MRNLTKWQARGVSGVIHAITEQEFLAAAAELDASTAPLAYGFVSQTQLSLVRHGPVLVNGHLYVYVTGNDMALRGDAQRFILKLREGPKDTRPMPVNGELFQGTLA